MVRPFKAIFINVNSIVSRHRRHYINLFLREHKPDALLLAEHKLSSRHIFELPGYRIFRQDRSNGRGGGTAILVREELSAARLPLDLGNIENTAVEIRRLDGSVLVIISMYLRPQITLSASDLEPLIRLSARGGLLVGADLNAKHADWGGSVNNTSGLRLREFLLSCPDLLLRNTERPTRTSGESASFIDFMLTSPEILPIMQPAEGLRTLDYESDHRAVEIIFQMDELTTRGRRTMLDYGKMDKRLLNDVLSQTLPSCMLPTDRNVTVEEIDACIESLTSAFGAAIEEAVPRVSINGTHMLKLPDNILRFINERKRLRRVLNRTEDVARIPTLKAIIGNLDKIIQGAVRVFEGNYWTEYLRNIRISSSTYRRVKRAAGLRREPVADIVQGGDTIITDEGGKASFLAEKFYEIHATSGQSRSPALEDTISNAISTLRSHTPIVHFGSIIKADGILNENSTTPEFLVTPSDIGRALSRRPSKKSTGSDGISDFVLKRTNMITWRCLALIVNHCYNIGYFPRAWKCAMVVPVLKPGAESARAGDYRPISLLCSFGKLMEWFILDRIQRRILEGGILKECQFGFKRGHSTSHALAILGHYVTSGLDRRCPTIAVSLDFAKAFDTVWQEGIIYKMMMFGFDRNLCRVVNDFLHDRSFRVRVGDAFSVQRVVRAGVPQGSLLGPVLYNIFISDIPLPDAGGLLLIYADDILVAAKGARAALVNARLVEYLSRLYEYFCKWGLRLNIEKTDCVIFRGKRGRLYPNSRQYIPVVRIGGATIRTSSSIRYLGVVLHENFEFYRHIDFLLNRMKRIYHTYCALLRRKEGLRSDVKLLIYRQIIGPLISYAFPVWFGISSHQMERLRIWERRILLACLGLRPRVTPSGTLRSPSCRLIYTRAGIERIDVFLVRTAVTFLERSASLRNGILGDCFSVVRDLDALRGCRYLSPFDLLSLRNVGLLYRGADLLFYHRRIGTLSFENLVYNTAQ